jgi:hypothetical protein
MGSAIFWRIDQLEQTISVYRNKASRFFIFGSFRAACNWRTYLIEKFNVPGAWYFSLFGLRNNQHFFVLPQLICATKPSTDFGHP